MGGFFRAVTRIFSKPKQVVVQQQAPVQTVSQTAKKTLPWETIRGEE